MVEKLEFGEVFLRSFGATNPKIYTENINGELYCDVLQSELRQFLAKAPVQEKMVSEQDLAPWHT